MNYVKKMCILRQIKQGFSGDGKPLSGLIRIEQYGQNVAVEVSIINFAPLSYGEYYCLIADSKGNTELLPLRGKSLFNIVSKIDIERGFCGVICFVKQEITPIAYGINGHDYYDIHALIDELERSPAPSKKELPPKKEEFVATAIAKDEGIEDYDDETIVKEDYYKKAYGFEEEEDERKRVEEGPFYAATESAAEEKGADERNDFEEDEDDEDVVHPFKADGEGYYSSVKDELDGLFQKYPKDETLCDAFASSQWVRLKGDENTPEYLVGVIYESLKPKYVCYALFGNASCPPEEIKDESVFIPHSLFDEEAGYYVIFQSASTGECIKPEKI